MSSRIELLWTDFERTGLYLRSWSKTTLRTYRQAFTSFQQSQREPSVNVQPPASGSDGLLSKAQLEVWVIWLRKKGLTPGGCNMYIRTINSFLGWLHEEKHLDQPLRLKLLPNPTKPLRGFSEGEIRSLLSFRPNGFYDQRTWTLINTLLDTGCRIEELLTLHTRNIDLDNLVFRVHGKGSKERIVPFSAELRKHLFRHQKYVKGEFFFAPKHGGRLSYRNTYRDIKNLCAKAGVVGEHVHPHSFRHCFAVTYIRRGGDLYRLSRILGHTSVSTTQIYLRSMGIEQIGENHSSLSPLCRG